jgi:hypothetical protein
MRDDVLRLVHDGAGHVVSDMTTDAALADVLGSRRDG